LVAFIRVYSENFEQKASNNGLKNWQMSQKRNMRETGAKESVVVGRLLKRSQIYCIRTIRCLEGISEIGWPYSCRPISIKLLTHLENCFDKRTLGLPTCRRPPVELIPHVQPFRHSEVSATIVQGILVMAQASSRHWYHPYDACFASMKNAGVMGSWSLPEGL
jgi:hypothetical protein